MSIAETAEMLGLGAAFGAFGGLFGVGGGIIAIPVLVLLFGMTEQAAQGTALVMILPTVLMGFWKYRQRNSIDGRMAVLLGASAVLATYVSARLANAMASATLRAAFGAFLVMIAFYFAWKVLRPIPEKKRLSALDWRFSWLVGLSGGLLSGLFGVGGATIAPPALTTFFRLSQTAAQGLALAMIAPGTIVALAVYAHAGVVDWNAGLAMAVGGLVAVPAGVALAHKLKAEKLRLLFCGFLVLSATMIMAGR
jgi:uncharacterized membrane protein YfcA